MFTQYILHIGLICNDSDWNTIDGCNFLFNVYILDTPILRIFSVIFQVWRLQVAGPWASRRHLNLYIIIISFLSWYKPINSLTYRLTIKFLFCIRRWSISFDFVEPDILYFYQSTSAFTYNGVIFIFIRDNQTQHTYYRLQCIWQPQLDISCCLLFVSLERFTTILLMWF